ncbi:YiiD C-terminal domain-containing protein [Nocardioides sp. zg-536]|uniref:YiiD C-terminal domain-containing protein n=1 Tax=Nocardioides faecalis TaxID=2803858 RepID=A0A938Y3E0_9ACTN|nr:YiiD C-terminal domain-containing protein [Nocardioides faecalis]MBM9461477.1 YiiD C-terminal domain-containing protein [Nocardioides faecalis]MBS4751805.1 YiiD C-terminal domain-containing protein [Nocardioides faecalis]QVI59336.1 YiiD C-terminal domain-containing protein [Nocardioides faecalis]
MTSLQQLTADIHRLIPLMGSMGIEIVEADGGTAAARIPAAPNVNHFGSMYAGSLFTVAEVLGGVLSYAGLAAEGAVPLVKSVTIDFLRPATTSVLARASLDDDELKDTLARYAEHGKADFELVAEVTDEAGTVVARTRGLYQLRRF